MISDWWSDDITFCANIDCTDTECFRHQKNMRNPMLPHSVADFADTNMCPHVKTKREKV